MSTSSRDWGKYQKNKDTSRRESVHIEEGSLVRNVITKVF